MTGIWTFIYNLFRIFAVESGPQAGPEEQTLEILRKYADYFQTCDAVRNMLRSIGFGLIKIMDKLIHTLLEVLGSVYQIVNFDGWLRSNATDTAIGRIGLRTLGSYISYILPMALIITGIILMVSAREIKGSKVLKNIALGAFVLFVLPFAIDWMGAITISFYNENNVSIAEEARIQASEYIDDVEWIFSGDGYADKIKQHNEILEDDLMNININETVHPLGTENTYATDWRGDAAVFHWVLRPRNNNPNAGQDTDVLCKRIKDAPDWIENYIPAFTGYYYRFHYDFIPLFLLYAAYLAVIVFTIARCIRLAYEIVVNHLVTTFLASTDFLSGKKLKEALLYLFYTYLTLMYAVLAIVIFSKFITFVSDYYGLGRYLQNLGDFQGLTKALIIFVAAVAVIDGPALIQKITGIDAGLKDGYNALDRMMRLGRGVQRTANTAVRTAKGAAHGVSAIGRGLTGGDMGRKSGGRRASENRPQTPQQAASEEKKRADQAYADRKPGTGASIGIAQSGKVGGQPVSTMKDMADAMKASDKDVLHGSFAMRRNAEGMKDNDRNTNDDTIQVPFNYRPRGGVTPQQAMNNAAQSALASRGLKADDYHFDGSEASLEGHDLKFGKPGAGFKTPLGKWANSPKKSGEQSSQEQTRSRTGQNGSRSGQGTGRGQGGQNPPQTPPKTPSQTPPQPVNPTGHENPKPSSPTGTTPSPTQTPEPTPVPTGEPSGGTSSGGTSPIETPGKNPANVPTPDAVPQQMPESTPVGKATTPEIPQSSPRDIYSPVQEYRDNSGSYQPVAMNVPTGNQGSYVTAANDAYRNMTVGTMDKGSMAYTQIELVNGTGMNRQTEIIGFNYPTSGVKGSSYKKEFNSTVTQFRNQSPNKGKGWNIGSVKIFKKDGNKKKK